MAEYLCYRGKKYLPYFLKDFWENMNQSTYQIYEIFQTV